MLRERSQTEQDRYCVLCICGIQEIVEWWLAGAGRLREWRRCWSNGTNLQLEDELVLGI